MSHSTSGILPTFAPEPTGYQPKKKHIHIDPRVLLKKQGAGRGNWGSVREMIFDGIAYERQSRITVEQNQMNLALKSYLQ